LCLGLWKSWQSCEEDAVPLALQKTSDVSQTSDVWKVIVWATGRSHILKNLEMIN